MRKNLRVLVPSCEIPTALPDVSGWLLNAHSLPVEPDFQRLMQKPGLSENVAGEARQLPSWSQDHEPAWRSRARERTERESDAIHYQKAPTHGQPGRAASEHIAGLPAAP